MGNLIADALGAFLLILGGPIAISVAMSAEPDYTPNEHQFTETQK